MDRLTIVHVATNLGLVPGVEQLGSALLDGGLATALGAAIGPTVDAPSYSAERVHPSRLLNAEGLVDVAYRQAAAVGEVLASGHFPVVLGGDDSVLFGSLLALGRRGAPGLVFLDAHIDFYPPERSETGEASDSELYLAFGFGPELLTELNHGEPLVADAATAVIGHRDRDEQRDIGATLRATKALVLSLADVRTLGPAEAGRRALAQLDLAGVDEFLIHIDADVLDDQLMPAVDYRIPGGLSEDEFVILVRTLLADDRASALDVTIYNPVLDPERRAQRSLHACLPAALART